MVTKPLTVISVHYDSMTTIAKFESSKYNKKQRRHVQVKLKFVRELVSDGVMAVDFVESKDNAIDPLTKGLVLDLV